MKSMRVVVFCLSFIATAGRATPQDTLFSIILPSLEGQKTSLGEKIRGSALSLFVLYSPECPICEKYVLKIKELEKEYRQQGVKVYLIFPGTHFDSLMIRNFAITYEVDFITLLDPQYRLTALLKGTVTPEAFVINRQGEIIYRGMIDNWFHSIGKRRGVVTENYVRDAIRAGLNGEKVVIKKTNPVGCYIYGLSPPQQTE